MLFKIHYLITHPDLQENELCNEYCSHLEVGEEDMNMS